MMNLHLSVVIFIGMIYGIRGNYQQLCSADDDCSYLGGLICIKSFCSLGVCSCPRNFASKWLGSDRKFQCVPVRKVGEPCSTSGDLGICTAANSECNMQANVCQCKSNYPVELWGGEKCEEYYKTVQGETCSSSIDYCSLAATKECSSQASWLWHNPMRYDIPTCSCRKSERLVISNDYVQINALDGGSPFPFITPMVHHKEPICTARLWGATCQEDDDCAGTGMECGSGNICVCSNSSHTYSYDKSTCGHALTYGALCHSSHFVVSGSLCDGAIGLMCGNLCDITGSEVIGGVNATCQCGPFHSGTTTCTQIIEGSTCVGDHQCKMWSPTGVCKITNREGSSIAGECTEIVNSATMATPSLMGIVLILVLVQLATMQ